MPRRATGDTIDVSSLGTFEFVGSAYDPATGAQATLSSSGGTTVLNLYNAGDDVADFTLQLTGIYTDPAGILGVVDNFA